MEPPDATGHHACPPWIAVVHALAFVEDGHGLVVVDHMLFHLFIVDVVVTVEYGFQRQTGFDTGFLIGIADAEAGNGEDVVGKFEDFADFDGIVPNGSDHADAEAVGFGRDCDVLHDEGRIDGGDQERFDVGVVEPFAFVHVEGEPVAVKVCAEGKEGRTLMDLKLIRAELCYSFLLVGIGDVDDAVGLEVARGAGLLTAPDQVFEQTFGERLIGVTTDSAMVE